MKSPFYKIALKESGEDITELVTGLEYEDNIGGDDIVKVMIRGLLISEGDREFTKAGAKLTFQFGFIEGKASKTKICTITNPEFDYVDGRMDGELVCRDSGYLLKKVTSNEVYQNKTASEIAQDISNKFGLNSDIQATTKRYEVLAAGNKNYMEFLNYLALQEGSAPSDQDGGKLVYAKNDTITFKNRDLSQDSVRLFNYADGDSGIIDLNISYDDVGTTATQGIQSSGVDSETGEAYNAKVTPDQNLEPVTGKEDVTFDVNGLISGPQNILNSQGASAGDTMSVPADNKSEALNKIGQEQKQAKISSMKLEMTIELDPSLESGEIFTMTGLTQQHNGNWRIYKLLHRVMSDGGKTVIFGDRNGSKVSNTTEETENSGKVNDTVGPDESSTERDLITFDQNGNRI